MVPALGVGIAPWIIMVWMGGRVVMLAARSARVGLIGAGVHSPARKPPTLQLKQRFSWNLLGQVKQSDHHL